MTWRPLDVPTIIDTYHFLQMGRARLQVVWTAPSGSPTGTRSSPALTGLQQQRYRLLDGIDGTALKCNVRYNLQMLNFSMKMQAMTGNIRLPDELGLLLKAEREKSGLSKSELANRAGKVREVIYRLEAGEDVTVSSLLAVLAALGLVLRIERGGMPSMQEVAARFASEDDDAP